MYVLFCFVSDGNKERAGSEPYLTAIVRIPWYAIATVAAYRIYLRHLPSLSPSISSPVSLSSLSLSPPLTLPAPPPSLYPPPHFTSKVDRSVPLCLGVMVAVTIVLRVLAYRCLRHDIYKKPSADGRSCLARLFAACRPRPQSNESVSSEKTVE